MTRESWDDGTVNHAASPAWNDGHRSARDVILHAIHCDNDVGGNADRILQALQDNGYAVVRTDNLPQRPVIDQQPGRTIGQPAATTSTIDLPATLSMWRRDVNLPVTHMMYGATRG